MNLVDSSGWLEYFGDGSNADFFAVPIEDASNLIVPTLCISEVFKKIFQQRGENNALQAVAMMHQGKIIDLDASIALSAAKLGLDFKLPLADSIILATARANNALIWTQDSDFKDIDGVKYISSKKR
ncbi:MAG: type II toxin-antitoxin system VapC family toxin [Deltaproteobacteria bacterium]|nr:type II toxin-antitoxin system VapC family toxin [Deltaproteobacteria bacterium]MBM4347741.1 type II toxin-antitoxin system VapC family toxin [Deltaproteobacteria bacterium]